MALRSGARLFAALFVLLITGSVAQAIPIRDIPGLQGIALFETSGSQTTLFNMLPGGSVITQRRSDRLSFSNSDFASNASEFYDFFYSDADGTFNPNGAFLSITAVFDGTPDRGLNIERVELAIVENFVLLREYASVVSSFVALGSNPEPGSVDNVLGDTAGTTTFLGDTFGQPDNVRLRLTVGFESTGESNLTTVLEPSALIVFGVGLLGLDALRRHRKADELI
ncbi:MAG: hypothetical protein GKS00_13485 [Alphaproteobacteria bacterium]|nr:hypothetical protein [Alphaproteobacteria bacterium]